MILTTVQYLIVYIHATQREERLRIGIGMCGVIVLAAIDLKAFFAHGAVTNIVEQA
jgi:hypothetical protein